MMKFCVTGSALSIAVILWQALVAQQPSPDVHPQAKRVAGKTTVQLQKIAVDNKAKDQVEAILQLGYRPGDLSSTVPILAKLSVSQSELVRFAAEISLNKVGAPAAKHLKSLVESSDPNQLRYAYSAMRQIGPACKIYFPQIKTLLESESAAKRRMGLFALQGMEKNAVEMLDELIVSLDDPDFNNQCMACRTLEKLGPLASRAESSLVDLLNEGLPSAKSWAAAALGAINTMSAENDIPKLLAAELDSKGPIVQKRVLRGLANVGLEGQQYAEPVRKKMLGKNKFVSVNAAYALWRITGKSGETIDYFRNCFDEPRFKRDEGFSQDVVQLVGKMGNKGLPLLDKVIENLGNQSPGMRETALTAIHEIGPKAIKARDQVQKLLMDEDPLVREAARQTVSMFQSHQDKR